MNKRSNAAAYAVMVLLLTACAVGTGDTGPAAPVEITDTTVTEMTDDSGSVTVQQTETSMTGPSDASADISNDLAAPETAPSETEMSIYKVSPPPETDPADKLRQCNAVARSVYDAARDYAIDCEVAGYPVTEEGWTVRVLSEGEKIDTRDGRDMSAYLCGEVGQYGGVAEVYIRDGEVLRAVWMEYPWDGAQFLEDTKSLTADEIRDGIVFGRYPDAVELSTDTGDVSTMDGQELVDYYNSNAKLIYCNAATYCTMCEVRGEHIPGGNYFFELKATDEGYKEDGTELVKAMCSMMGVYGGYGAVIIDDEGYPKAAYWSDTAPLSDDSLPVPGENVGDKVIAEHRLVGSYPDAVKYIRSDGTVRPVSAEEAAGNAKLVYVNAATYATLCEVNGTPVPDGRYYFPILRTDTEDYSEDGTDMSGALSAFMGEVGGYAAVYMKDAVPVSTFWSEHEFAEEDEGSLAVYPS